MDLSGIYETVARVVGTVVPGAGAECVYVAPASTAFDPSTLKVTPGTQTFPVHAVFESIDARLIDGSSVQVGDEWAIIAADELPVTPTTAGRLRTGTRDLAVVRVDTIRPGGTAIMYRLQVRR